MKRHITRIICTITAFSALCSSCALFEKATMSVTPTIYECSSKSNTLSLKLKTNQEWTLTSDQSWAKPNITTGVEADSLIKVSISQNSEYDDRTAILSFSSKRCDPVCVRIIQAQKDAMTLDSDVKEFDHSGGDFSVELTTNIDYNVTVDDAAANWIKITATKGLTKNTLSFNVSGNKSTENRRGTISITSSKGLSRQISVYQKGLIYRMSLTHTNAEITVPTLDGGDSSTEGTIDWGDGTQEEYTTKSQHTYQDSGEHTVSFVVTGLSTIHVGGIAGITSISLD